MRMTDFVVREAIISDLTATTREGVIREMINRLSATGYLRPEDVEDVFREIMRREQLASTGIGRGIAIPHAKHPSLERLVGTVAVSHAGVPFDSIDREPVHVFVLLISPKDRPGDHLRALENVVRRMRDDQFVRSLQASVDHQQIWELLEDQSRQLEHR
jgi:mannitol/fructose-specific phosphotransferase system IIA component (Ntr-type)